MVKGRKTTISGITLFLARIGLISLLIQAHSSSTAFSVFNIYGWDQPITNTALSSVDCDHCHIFIVEFCQEVDQTEALPTEYYRWKNIVRNNENYSDRDEKVIFKELAVTDNALCSAYHKVDNGGDSIKLTHYAPKVLDRTCLLAAAVEIERAQTHYDGPWSKFGDLPSSDAKEVIDSLLSWSNQQLNVFHTATVGELSPAGRVLGHNNMMSIDRPGMQCPRMQYSEGLDSFKQYWLRQSPVVIEGFPSAGSTHNLNIFELMQSYYGEKVGVKLSPTIEFEGVEFVDTWRHGDSSRASRKVKKGGTGRRSKHGAGGNINSRTTGSSSSSSSSSRNIGAYDDRKEDTPEHVTSYLKEQIIPAHVLDQLESPDMAVIRASHEEMTIQDAMRLMIYSNSQPTHIVNSSSTSSNIYEINEFHAYVEYTSLLPFPSLHKSLLPKGVPTWLTNITLEGKPYLWLGDGNTKGMLHFDPFDNLLVQLEGSKTFHLMDPLRNERFYEGHMREVEWTSRFTLHHRTPVVDEDSDNTFDDNAEFKIEESRGMSYRFSTGSSSASSYIGDTQLMVEFGRRYSESTSMVHSPVNFRDVDTKRFPKAVDTYTSDDRESKVEEHISKEEAERNSSLRSASSSSAAAATAAPAPPSSSAAVEMQHMDCTVRAGEALWVPSYFWHEVTSTPGNKVEVPTDMEPEVFRAESFLSGPPSNAGRRHFAKRMRTTSNQQMMTQQQQETGRFMWPTKSEVSVASEATTSKHQYHDNGAYSSGSAITTTTTTTFAAAADDDVAVTGGERDASGQNKAARGNIRKEKASAQAPLSSQWNVAVNYWFAPLYEKEMPCSTCRKRFNPKYREIIKELVDSGVLNV